TYKLKIPQNNRELVVAGKQLKNCVANGSYEKRIKSKESFILFGYKNDKLHFCVEFTNKLKLSFDDVYYHHNQIFLNPDNFKKMEESPGEYFIIQARGFQNSPIPEYLTKLIHQAINNPLK